ncbi:MAG: VWA domain-containing protein, partial [Planctomycetaceae bacterium]
MLFLPRISAGSLYIFRPCLPDTGAFGYTRRRGRIREHILLMGIAEFNLVFDTPDWPMLLRSAAGVLLLCELAAMVLSLHVRRSWAAAISLWAVGLLTAPAVIVGIAYRNWTIVSVSLLGGVALMAIVATFGLMTSVAGQPMRGKVLLASLFRGTILVSLAAAGWAWPLSGSVLVIGACAAFWMLRSYRRTTAEISAAKKAGLLALRILAVLLLTACLARPAMEYERSRPIPSVILLGVDTSSSMNRKDAAANSGDNADPQARIAAVSDALKNNAHLLQTLTNQGEVNIFTFSLNSKPHVLLPGKAEGKPPVASSNIWNLPKADGAATAIGDSAAEAFAPYAAAGRDVSAMILLSDGCNNTADTIEPDKQAELLGQHGVPVFAVGVGSDTVTKSVRSLGVKTLRAPDEVDAFNRLPITATIEAMGLEGRQIKVTCRFGDTDVGSELFTVTGRQDTHTSRFEHMPLAAGYHRLTVTATLEGKPVDGLERKPAMSKLVHVLDRELRVLYIEGKFRYETKYITQAIEAGKRFSIDRRILMQPFSERRPSPLSEDPRDWLRYHAIIFGDVDASHFSPNQLKIIKELIGEKGKGFCMIGGMSSFGRGGWAGTP